MAPHVRRNDAGLRPVEPLPVIPLGTDGASLGRALLGHADAAYAYALRLTRKPSDAEDLVQESFTRALGSAAGFRGGNLKAWLFQIVRNTYIDLHHRGAGRAQAELLELADDTPLFQDDIELDRLRRAVAQDIEAALRDLSEEARSIILFDLEGFTETEVATLMGCAVGTVKSRLARARALLRGKLQDYMR
jgi:RNA polymerase sigma-70 factor (ECF subfamily)